MGILTSTALLDTLRTFGVVQVVPPRLASAKQTETVQRFKVHLKTSANEDLATKVEFSRRGFDEPVQSEPIPPPFLSVYRMPPLVVPHYGAAAAARQKVEAILGRRRTEARDIFDLFILSPRLSTESLATAFTKAELVSARERVFSVEYEQFRDTVVSFLASEDQTTYDSKELWGEVRLRAVHLLDVGEAK